MRMNEFNKELSIERRNRKDVKVFINIYRMIGGREFYKGRVIIES